MTVLSKFHSAKITVQRFESHQELTYSDGRVIRFIMKDRTMHRGLHRAGRGALDPQVP